MFFCFVLSEGTCTSFFKDKKSKRSHKVFLLMDPDPGGPNTCGSGGPGTLENFLCFLLEVFRQSRELDLFS
jgi:hypothetical protein